LPEADLSKLEREDQRHHAELRREVIRWLFAKGYKKGYGFKNTVVDAIESSDDNILWSYDALQRDIETVEEEIRSDHSLDFGRERILDILASDLQDLTNELAKARGRGGASPNEISGLMNTRLKIISKIVDIEGLDAPKETKHSHSLEHLVHHLSHEAIDAIGKSESIQEVEAVLVPEIGQEETRHLLSRLSEVD